MQNDTLNLHRLSSLLIILFLGGYITIIGQSILSPIAFAALFSFLLLPISRWLERYISYIPLAIFLSMIIALLPLIGLLVLFSVQFATVINDIPAIGRKLRSGLEQVIAFVEQYVNLDTFSIEESLKSNFSQLIEAPLQILGQSLSSGSNMLISILLTVLFTFFIMLYRTSFKNFFLMQFSRSKRDEAMVIMEQVERVLKEYLTGLLAVILILGVLNSIGLWLIGINYAAFWGFLAACLAIIPYIGTTLGGTFPFVYALATTGTLWQPAAVVLLYMSIQTLEGNFITPKVVGSSVSINPFAAIVFLFVGGMIWGVSGLILALPFVAVLKVVMEHIAPLQPVSELLSSDVYSDAEKFLNEYDHARYRISNYFNRKYKS
ncbi:AI-2E family transporter [Phaeodactylibacter sp.]|jgi:predicted PurR-regulated permease PerM|uniref:AI-2E family transporter n=1 Tax=Phaeodactylibacter sp. TaxID=1940289 RepID=UPI0025E65E0D|nr:AI-2E family transporter [Phaeodactylibacter sp.]MCI4651283.1 AI-2E family transporter [Phaeodactylibacter sp.]MCI5092468.1 AI-2E family transporter [Phaeodactylibacter sp.]